MDDGRTPQPPRDPGKDTQFFLGELNGKVNSLSEQVTGFNKKFEKKAETDRINHDTLMAEQKKLGERIFDKMDELRNKAHPTPCPKLQSVCSDVDVAERDIKAMGKEHGKLKTKVSNITTTGRVSWKAILVAGAIAAFLIGSVTVPILIYYLSQNR